MAAKLISVIIPVYQGEKYLAEALDSIFAQNYRPIEVLVVDDGSTDATVSIAKSYPEVRYCFQANQGSIMVGSLNKLRLPALSCSRSPDDEGVPSSSNG